MQSRLSDTKALQWKSLHLRFILCCVRGFKPQHDMLTLFYAAPRVSVSKAQPAGKKDLNTPRPPELRGHAWLRSEEAQN